MSNQPAPSRRPRLSEWELTWAFVAGGGIALIIVALGLNALNGASNDANSASTFNSLLIMGGLLLVGGTACWLIQLRPWRHYDDFSVPAYTGHHDDHATHAAATDHAVHDDHAPASQPATSINAAPIIPPPVMIDPMSAFSPDVVRGAGVPMHDLVTTETRPDNFERLHGVGPKAAAALVAAGIFTYGELAQRSPADVETIIHTAGVRLPGSAATWPEQAKLAASGNWNGLERYTTEPTDQAE